MKNLFFSIVFALTIFVYFSFGCSLNRASLPKFDATEYIFIGEVVGYTENLKFPKSQRETAGLVIKATEKVYLPKTPKKHFEVFPFGLGADCSTLGTDKKILEKEFPVGIEIRVIAKEAKIFPNFTIDGNIRLEIRSGELSSIARNSYENGERMTNANSVFDYQTFVNPTPEDYTESFMPFLEAKSFLPDFEIRKDLLRLEKSNIQSKKSQILNRLLYVPAGNDVSFNRLLKKYTGNRTEFEDLYYKRLFEIEGLSDEDYKVIKKTVPSKYRKKYKNNI